MAQKIVLKKKLVKGVTKATAKAAPKAKAAPAKVKKAASQKTRVNFDFETGAYELAAAGALKFGKSISSAGRLFLQAVADLGNGSKSAAAQAAKALLSMEAPEGSRTPNGLGTKPEPKAKTAKVAAPAKKTVVKSPAKAAPVKAKSGPVKAKATPAPAKTVAAPAKAPVKFKLKLKAA